MTHQLNHRDLPVQKAGQAVGAALLLPSLPRNTLNSEALAPGDAARVAGRDPETRKTGTAAPASCLPGVLPNQRRVLCHLAAARNTLRQRSMQRIAVSPHYLFCGPTASAVPYARVGVRSLALEVLQ